MIAWMQKKIRTLDLKNKNLSFTNIWFYSVNTNTYVYVILIYFYIIIYYIILYLYIIYTILNI